MGPHQSSTLMGTRRGRGPGRGGVGEDAWCDLCVNFCPSPNPLPRRGEGFSMNETDYYELLQVERTADDRTIKSAYRRLAMECHPDRNGGCTDAEARFKAISEAYDCLKDPNKRAA